MFCILNGHNLDTSVDDAVTQMWAVAVGDVDEDAMATWLRERLD